MRSKQIYSLNYQKMQLVGRFNRNFSFYTFEPISKEVKFNVSNNDNIDENHRELERNSTCVIHAQKPKKVRTRCELWVTSSDCTCRDLRKPDVVYLGYPPGRQTFRKKNAR